MEPEFDYYFHDNVFGVYEIETGELFKYSELEPYLGNFGYNLFETAAWLRDHRSIK